MPTWGQELQELAGLVREQEKLAQQGRTPEPGGQSPHDILRRKYLKNLNQKTGRAVIVYATAWMDNKPDLDANSVSIVLGDVAGFMEAASNIEEKELDLFLHSPGGYPEAAESIVEYLRTRFDHIRAVVPIAAMSAATMMALACDEILMGSHSQLGPIDPQFTIPTPEGPRSSPGQAILDQFELAKKECQDPKNIGAWMPILRSYLPGLLAQCYASRDLSEKYVTDWLKRFMFKDEKDGEAMAKKVAEWFSDYGAFQSHGRRVSRDAVRDLGCRVIDLEEDQELQDAVLSVHHAYSLTLGGTPATKIIENHHGRAWINQHIVQQVQFVQQPQPGQAPPQQTQPQLPRDERRRQEREARKKQK